MQRNTGYFPTESLEPSGNRLFSRSALNEGYLFRGSLTVRMTCERFLSKNLIVNLPAPYRRERLLQQCASFVPPFSFIFQLNTNYILSIGNKIPFAHSLPEEEEEQERSIFL